MVLDIIFQKYFNLLFTFDPISSSKSHFMGPSKHTQKSTIIIKANISKWKYTLLFLILVVLKDTQHKWWSDSRFCQKGFSCD